ncbi:MAG: ATP-binding region ATPase domain protein [Planctomycetaceae bacterium]|nr:ATP-binding region ATPase domain protein [Planctomycetaceae bacterium]
MSDGTLATLEKQIAELQSQLMESQKLSTVGALAASITHEFNNILTTVINYAKLGLRHKDDEQRDKAFNKILAAAQRASRITTGMLAYARNKSERRDEINLAQLVDEVLLLVEKDLEVNRVKVEVIVQGEPRAVINVGQLQQVVLNLIINARQAMKEGGRLTITVKSNREEGWAEIAVKDSGTGIPAENLKKIFERFFTTKSADSQGQGGTGLGLALCRDVIESHQGRIRVESTVGKGTTFTLKLPLVGAVAAAKPGPTPTTQKAG